MKGVLVVSHGKMARGLVESARFIMGDAISQLEYCCYEKESTPSSFERDLKDKRQKIDTSEGIIILMDIASGTAFQKTVLLLQDNVEIITGVNMPLLMEVLTRRHYDSLDNINDLIEKGRQNIWNVREHLPERYRAEE